MKNQTNKYLRLDDRSMIKRVLLFILLFAPALLFSVSVYGAVIFQDNFDNALSGAYSGGTIPSGWSQWMIEGGISASISGITHYAGEITVPGRGNTGKSLKLWRNSSAWEGYSGSLVYIFPSAPSYSDIYIRWYMKLPTSLDLSGNADYLKLFRLNISGGTGEIYVNINNLSGVGAMRANGVVRVLGSSWQTVLNNADLQNVWDGNWHCWEMRFGINASRLTLWIDGVQKYNSTSFNYGASSAGQFTMLQHFPVGNHSSGSQWQSSWQALEIDDLVIADTYTGPDGSSPAPVPPQTPVTVSTLFNEGFDDNNFASRGWFDDTSVDIDTATKYAGAGSLRLRWGAGQTNPPLVMAMRKDFTATDSLYVSMYWRFNSDWVGSGVGYHPHLVYILSDRDDHWGGLAANYLDTYIEPHGRGAYLILQDLLNSPAVCGSGCFYAPAITFSLNTWYHIETYFKMNTVTNGIPAADGIMQMWVNGVNVYNATNRIYRNGQNPNLKWRTFVIAPWIGDGSPQAQTMWLDELTVATAVPGSSPQPTPPDAAPSAPTGLRIIGN